ncbi:yrdC domain-containing protein, mitochondrial [Ischnura elegans]|uniref:yrdC domain-containing protein, mitochondrial n=1 Tax=Ischnura elegans TaxID=197161 RepID=UPI001ED88A7A|nr:yrdC domain-containing protein, mitochondrial [Ischnura elegans]
MSAKVVKSLFNVASHLKEPKNLLMSPVVKVSPSKESLALAVKLLKDGDIVSLPTDTVYGIAADAQNTRAIRKLYEVKGRDAGKPLAICVSDPENVGDWCNLSYNISSELLRALLPGPVTLVLERKDVLNFDLNPGVSSVGIRVPNHPFVREVTRRLGSPLALTSANKSSELSSLSVAEFSEMWDSLGAVFDGGHLGAVSDTSSRHGSTVVDLVTPGYFKIIRPGCALQNTVKILKSYGILEWNQ